MSCKRKRTNKLKGFLALTLLAISWVVLLWLTGSKTPWFTTFGSRDNAHITLNLGDVPVQQYTRMGFTGGMVKYNRTGNFWLVGTEQGNILAVDMQGRQLWRRNFGIGKITALAISDDGNKVYVGEQSPAGQVYALNAQTGDILWKFATAETLGSEPALRSNPSITRIVVDGQERIYFSAYRFRMNKNAQREYFSKVYVLSARGEALGQYPPDKPMDAWVNWFAVAPEHNVLTFSTSNYDVSNRMQYTDNLYFLDLKHMQLQNSKKITPIEPFERTVMRASPIYSTDEKYLAGIASDGRGFLFDTYGQPLWQVSVAKPTNIGGEWVNAIGRKALLTEYGVVFTTLNTFNRNNWQLSTPVEHPGNNGIFIFDYDGNFKAKFTAGGNTEETESKGDLLAVAVGRNVRTRTYQEHGAMLIDLKQLRIKQLYKTAGPVQAVDISDDLHYIAAIEAPAQIDSGKIIGEYRLHIWDINNAKP